MKNLKLQEEKLKKIALAAGVSLTLVGCTPTESVDHNYDDYDILETNDSVEKLKEGITQEIEVDGENFKLIVNYSVEELKNDKWTITSGKKIRMRIKTKNLDENCKVWIDNVHTDTSTVSSNNVMDGILQDTMDDRIHNSLIMGFPISDNQEYSGVNEIEGQNETFIRGSFHGFNGHSSGEVEEKRYLESDYLENGVWGSLVASSIDLLIQKEGEKEPRAVSVLSELIVEANNTIVLTDYHGEKTYRMYDRDGDYNDYSEKEYVKIKK